MHRLIAFQEMSPIDQFSQGANDVRFELGVHGEVGVIPVAHNTQAFKVFSLSIDLPLSVIAAFLPKL